MTAQVRELPTNVSTLSTEIVKVTPAIAEKWLGKNVRNRNVRRAAVEAYAKSMRAGEWMLTGEAIKFAESGELLDGQHRLIGVCESGKTISMVVIRGLPLSAQDVLDTGRARTAGDQLGIHGFTDPALLAAAAKIVVLYETDLFYRDNKIQVVSHREILEVVNGNGMLAYATQRARAVAKGAYMRPAIAAMTFYELMKIDDQAAPQFFDRLGDGADLSAGNAILALRARLRTLHDERTLLPMEAQVALVFRTWNAWRAKRNVGSLPLYRQGELIKCPVPK